MSDAKKEEIKKLPRTFMSPAYLQEVEHNVFGLFRDILIEENGVKEKFGEPIGPIFLFRPASMGEKEDMLTSRPDGQVIRLKKIVQDPILPPDFQPK